MGRSILCLIDYRILIFDEVEIKLAVENKNRLYLSGNSQLK